MNREQLLKITESTSRQIAEKINADAVTVIVVKDGGTACVPVFKNAAGIKGLIDALDQLKDAVIEAAAVVIAERGEPGADCDCDVCTRTREKQAAARNAAVIH